jgi:hypothetical protein
MPTNDLDWLIEKSRELSATIQPVGRSAASA